MDWLLYDRDLVHGRVNLHVERDCLEKLQEYCSDPRLLGRFKPRCNPDGTYEPVQCLGKSKYVFQHN